MKTNSMLDDWITMGAILTTRKSELEKIYVIVKANILGEMRKVTRAYTIENEE